MIAFYVGLGFTLKRRDLEQGEFISHLTGLSNMVMETAKVALPDGYVLELIMHVSHPLPDKAMPPEGYHPPLQGLDHCGFTVDDINEVIAKVVSLGGKVVTTPKWTNPGLPSIHAYVNDPEGNLIHLSQNA